MKSIMLKYAKRESFFSNNTRVLFATVEKFTNLPSQYELFLNMGNKVASFFVKGQIDQISQNISSE